MLDALPLEMFMAIVEYTDISSLYSLLSMNHYYRDAILQLTNWDAKSEQLLDHPPVARGRICNAQDATNHGFYQAKKDFELRLQICRSFLQRTRGEPEALERHKIIMQWIMPVRRDVFPCFPKIFFHTREKICCTEVVPHGFAHESVCATSDLLEFTKMSCDTALGEATHRSTHVAYVDPSGHELLAVSNNEDGLWTVPPLVIQTQDTPPLMKPRMPFMCGCCKKCGTSIYWIPGIRSTTVRELPSAPGMLDFHALEDMGGLESCKKRKSSVHRSFIPNLLPNTFFRESNNSIYSQHKDEVETIPVPFLCSKKCFLETEVTISDRAYMMKGECMDGRQILNELSSIVKQEDREIEMTTKMDIGFKKLEHIAKKNGNEKLLQEVSDTALLAERRLAELSQKFSQLYCNLKHGLLDALRSTRFLMRRPGFQLDFLSAVQMAQYSIREEAMVPSAGSFQLKRRSEQTELPRPSKKQK